MVSYLGKRRYTWMVCRDCGIKIVIDVQDHEKLIVESPAFAWDQCCMCYNYRYYKITVQQNTQDWLVKFTFREAVKEYEKLELISQPLEDKK